MQQLKSRFDGRVQGVGFRATVVDIASRLDVVGWVQNSPDGSVEMLAQGREAELLSLQSQIRVRFVRNIVSEHSDWQDLDQLAFESFDIAF